MRSLQSLLLAVVTVVLLIHGTSTVMGQQFLPDGETRLERRNAYLPLFAVLAIPPNKFDPDAFATSLFAYYNSSAFTQQKESSATRGQLKDVFFTSNNQLNVFDWCGMEAANAVPFSKEEVAKSGLFVYRTQANYTNFCRTGRDSTNTTSTHVIVYFGLYVGDHLKVDLTRQGAEVNSVINVYYGLGVAHIDPNIASSFNGFQSSYLQFLPEGVPLLLSNPYLDPLLYDPDTTNEEDDVGMSMVTVMTQNTVVIWVIFGCLLGVVVLAVILFCVCLRRIDRTAFNRDRKTIRSLFQQRMRGETAPQSSDVPPTGDGEVYPREENPNNVTSVYWPGRNPSLQGKVPPSPLPSVHNRQENNSRSNDFALSSEMTTTGLRNTQNGATGDTVVNSSLNNRESAYGGRYDY